MSDTPGEPTGPDLARGIPAAELRDGAMLAGHVDGKPVLLVRRGGEIFAVGGQCTHYGGPLADGLLVDDTVRCPWHHACFSLRTGAPTRPPALNSLSRWRVEQHDGVIVVGGEMPTHPTRSTAVINDAPRSIVVVGAGAAADVAAATLRAEGYRGRVTIIGAEASPPCDRPNLSKDYLAGNAPEEWIPLRPASFYAEQDIDLVLGRRVAALDTASRRVTLDDGSTREYGALLLATGAAPVRLEIPGAAEGRILYLRTLADSRAIVAAAERARRAVVIGASFIGLEVAASLRGRGLEVHVIGREARPLERVMGPELGDFIRKLHEANGVVFHLGDSVRHVDPDSVTLGSGARLPAELIVAGVGVRPSDELAARAGLTIDRGILVDETLATSAPGVFAAGDVARYPDPRTGDRIRVEHWVVAQRMGQTAARNMLRGADSARRERFDAVPFFWSQHYDVTIAYVGHAERWDEILVDGDLAARDCLLRLRGGGRTLAVVALGRDRASLEAELAMERGAL